MLSKRPGPMGSSAPAPASAPEAAVPSMPSVAGVTLAPGEMPAPAPVVAASALAAAALASVPEATLEPCATEPFVRVCRVVVKADRMVCDVQLSPACPRVSSPLLISALLQAHPQLAEHACKNERGTTFGAVMNRTPLIHVLEHVAIDCMVQNESAKTTSSDTLFVGNSRWLDPVQGLGRVELGFRDDIAALRALKTAVEQVNQALASR